MRVVEEVRRLASSAGSVEMRATPPRVVYWCREQSTSVLEDPQACMGSNTASLRVVVVGVMTPDAIERSEPLPHSCESISSIVRPTRSPQYLP